MKLAIRAISAVCLLSATSAVFAALSVTFDRTSIHISGVSRRGQIAIDAALNEPAGPAKMYIRYTQLAQALTDDDGDGVVDFDLGRDISPRSVWAVVDVTTGEYVIAAPPGSPVRNATLSPTLSRKADPDVADEVIGRQLAASLLWIRPGASGSAWHVRTADGGSSDADHANNGRTVSPTTNFEVIAGKDKPPKKLKKDDLIVVIDPFMMTYRATRVTQ